MKNFQCLAIDMGASCVRIVMGEVEDNKIAYREIYRFNNEIEAVDGCDRWNIHKIYNQILKGITEGLAAYSSIESIGIDNVGA
ncbi:MAG: hypothetical protein HC896_11560 [Bacteroidales bacterium]|nr:hypothetical protein [Bacteroidales bacterium]